MLVIFYLPYWSKLLKWSQFKTYSFSLGSLLMFYIPNLCGVKLNWFRLLVLLTRERTVSLFVFCRTSGAKPPYRGATSVRTQTSVTQITLWKRFHFFPIMRRINTLTFFRHCDSFWELLFFPPLSASHGSHPSLPVTRYITKYIVRLGSRDKADDVDRVSTLSLLYQQGV